MDNENKTEFLELVKKLIEVQKLAKQNGIFIDDRNLLECPRCQLIEDVAITGQLFTYWKSDKNYKDTGLRFIELNQNDALFQCPNCGNCIAQEEKEY